MSEELWADIIADYKKARACLWGAKHSDGWYRKENEGHYYLLKAYLAAKESEKKDYLWYARILFMMVRENKYKQSDYDILTYLTSCVEAYGKAIVDNSCVSEKEIKAANEEYEDYLYIYNCRCQSEKEGYSLIDGLSADDNFQFHDSKVISFSHNDKTACLTLEFEGIRKEIEFFGIEEISVFYSSDPAATWIFDFYCYRHRLRQSLICFDVGIYKILCEEIRCK